MTLPMPPSESLKPSAHSIAATAPKPTADSLLQQAGWKASIELGFAPSSSQSDKTVVYHRKQQGPLAIQRPLYPEGDICHVYLLHPPGGVVGGDQLQVKVDSCRNAHALVTTPGATKFYRSAGDYAYQRQTLSVKAGSLLEWLPQENIYFPEAKVRLDTEISLEDSAKFIGWELHCFGRPALKEGFSKGCVLGTTRFTINNQLILVEQLNVQGGDPHQQTAGLRTFPMLGTMFISNSDEELLGLVQSLLDVNTEYLLRCNVIAGVTELSDDSETYSVMVIRAMGEGTEPMLAVFTRIWQAVREYWYGKSPKPPRIWAT